MTGLLQSEVYREHDPNGDAEDHKSLREEGWEKAGCEELLAPPEPETDYEGWRGDLEGSAGITVLNLGGQREYLNMTEELVSGFSIMISREATGIHDPLLSGMPSQWEEDPDERMRQAVARAFSRLDKTQLDALEASLRNRFQQAGESERGELTVLLRALARFREEKTS